MFVVWECPGYRQSFFDLASNKSLFHPTWGYNCKHSCIFPGKCLDQSGRTSVFLCVRVNHFFTTQLDAYNPKYLKNLANKGWKGCLLLEDYSDYRQVLVKEFLKNNFTPMIIISIIWSIQSMGWCQQHQIKY